MKIAAFRVFTSSAIGELHTLLVSQLMLSFPNAYIWLCVPRKGELDQSINVFIRCIQSVISLTGSASAGIVDFRQKTSAFLTGGNASSNVGETMANPVSCGLR